VNPSLSRQAKLNRPHGLFEVVPGIYQVRGYDISNITFIRSDSGWIVVDPLTIAETARTARGLVDKQFGRLPIVAVIYTTVTATTTAASAGSSTTTKLPRAQCESSRRKGSSKRRSART
jgi:alkyl sulfatase BDS1-like metallo-beta-lactamase superfamily hydrolase